jgi:hypothetical protein
MQVVPDVDVLLAYKVLKKDFFMFNDKTIVNRADDNILRHANKFFTYTDTVTNIKFKAGYVNINDKLRFYAAIVENKGGDYDWI